VVFTQSLNAFAIRSPASIVCVDDETAALKAAAYEAIWTESLTSCDQEGIGMTVFRDHAGAGLL
jgi:hypothetical protein